jgi:hypothetical protein
VDPKSVTPLLVLALVIFGVYRRMRRTFGRQNVSAPRMWVRIVLLTIVGGLVAYAAVRNVTTLEGLLGGVICGAALALLGLKHTQFEVTPEGHFYTPHTYIGLAVTALFLGRIVYRYSAVLASPQAQPGPPNPNPFAAYQNSPWTAGIFGVLVAYYILYYVGILLKSRTLSQRAA